MAATDLVENRLIETNHSANTGRDFGHARGRANVTPIQVSYSVQRTTYDHGGHGIDHQNAGGGDQEGATVYRPHAGKAAPRAPVEQTESHPGGHSGQSREGDMGEHAGAEPDQGKQEDGVQD